jgi:hypothetical protein
VVRRHELTDQTWAQVPPLLPATGRPGGQWADHRRSRYPTLQADRTSDLRAAFLHLRVMWQGQDSNLCRQCRRFTGRTAVSSRVPSHRHLVPIIDRDVHKRAGGSFCRPAASPPVPPHPARLGVGRREVGGNLGRSGWSPSCRDGSGVSLTEPGRPRVAWSARRRAMGVRRSHHHRRWCVQAGTGCPTGE